MSTDHETNKATIRRLHEATNTGDLKPISATIDELVEPDARPEGRVTSKPRR
jgi:hypothetical protein